MSSPPTDRARVLAADVQRFGLLSAASVVARYTEVVNRAIAGDDPLQLGAPTDGEPDPVWLVEGAARLAVASLRLLDAGTALLDRTRAATAPTAEEVVELPPTSPGHSSTATLWAHNPTGSAATLSVHPTPLVSGEGHLLPAEAVACHPGHLVRLAPGGSCEVGLGVTVPAHQPAGRYHGLVVGSVAPQPIRVVLQVTEGGVEPP